MSKIVVQISFYENKYRSFPTKVRIGSVDNVTIGLNSTISVHPIVSGDMIADHMFKDPSSITITGKISAHGDSYSVVLGANSLNRSIAQMQEMFEKVKNEGILCKVSKIDLDIGEQTPKFIKRENMVLSSIEWTEDIDDLKFSFTFTEVLTAKITVEQVDVTDSLLPPISDLVQTNFTDVFLDYDDVAAAVFYAYYEKGWITEDFISSAAQAFDLRLGNLDTSDIVTTGAAGVMIYKIWTMPATLKMKLIGTAATLLVVGAYRLAKAIGDMFERKKYRIQVFEDWQKDGQRFIDAVSAINQNVGVFNEAISVYQFQNDGEQIAYGNIANEYYKFKFETKFYQHPYLIEDVYYTHYALKVFDISDKIISSFSDISCALDAQTLFLAPQDSQLFKTKSGLSVILVDLNTNRRAVEDCHVNEFVLVSTSMDLTKFKETLTEVILNTFRG